MPHQPKEKTNLHPRNRHRQGYDFKKLADSCPELKPFLSINQHGLLSIDFADPQAVKILNRALLVDTYGIHYWDFPENYLCPPIPGRADYIHNLADLLADKNNKSIPRGKAVKILDIGVGANCIYPVIGHLEYRWRFTGSDIDPVAVKAAKKIVQSNEQLHGQVEIKHQPDSDHLLKGIIEEDDYFDAVITNPPFHATPEEAKKKNQRKWKNLEIKKQYRNVLNFGGRSTELWYEGGEVAFIFKLIEESLLFQKNVGHFTSLVSKKSNVPVIIRQLKKEKIKRFQVLEMGQGQKVSRIIAWTFIPY